MLPQTLWLVLALGALSVVAAAWLRYKLAIPLAIRAKRKGVDLFFGAVHVALWEENEGLLLLKNKKLLDVVYGTDPGVGGGTRVIFPIFGEEVRVRVPLSFQLTEFKDDNVLTRESLQVRVRVSIWWRVCDIKKYYYSISDAVHVHGEIGRPAGPEVRGGKPEVAERWVLTLAESALRTLVSQASFATLISTKPSSYLNVEPPEPAAHAPLPREREKAMHEVMAGELLAAIQPKVTGYGLEVERIEVQEVALLQPIQDAIDRFWKAALLPAQTQQEAKARQIELQSLASVLGLDVVRVMEVLKNYPRSGAPIGCPGEVTSLLLALKGESGPPVGGEPASPALRALADGVKRIKVGDICDGIVRTIKDYGAFVELYPGCQGLLHISEIDTNFVHRVEDVLSINAPVRVKILEITEEGKIRLSRKAVR